MRPSFLVIVARLGGRSARRERRGYADQSLSAAPCSLFIQRVEHVRRQGNPALASLALAARLALAGNQYLVDALRSRLLLRGCDQLVHPRLELVERHEEIGADAEKEVADILRPVEGRMRVAHGAGEG